MRGGDRLDAIDAARGAAVVLMVLVHSFHSWLSPEAKAGMAWGVVRTLGGYPAVGFLFVAGLLLALGSEGRYRKGRDAAFVRREALRRGAEVCLYAVLFRLWMFASGRFKDPASLLRVDVLNCIGLSLVLVALAVGFGDRRVRLAVTGGLAVALALVTPLVWGTAWPAWLPRPLLAYLDGRLTASYFPLLPWSSFAFAGAFAGVALDRAFQRHEARRVLFGLVPAGMVLMGAGELVCHLVPGEYLHGDYWKTSPCFTAWKLGVVMLVVGLAAVWVRFPGPSPLRLLGRTSLLVYWVHIEIVYGSYVTSPLKNVSTTAQATVGYVVVMAAMVALAAWRTRTLERRAANAAATSA